MKPENPQWTPEEIAAFQRSHTDAPAAVPNRIPPLESTQEATSNSDLEPNTPKTERE